MFDMKSPRERMYSDPQYKALVDWMVSQISLCNYTPSEMREAAILASIVYMERHPSTMHLSVRQSMLIDDFLSGKEED